MTVAAPKNVMGKYAPFVSGIIGAVLTVTMSTASAQSRRQPCPEPYNAATWVDCFGEATFAHGLNYAGEFRGGRPHGQGTMTYPGSNKYVGEWREGKRQGQGTMWYPIGHKYVGEWSDNRRNGRGTMSYPDGRTYVGEWKDGRRNGKGIEYGQDGSILRSGVWKNGVLEGNN